MERLSDMVVACLISDAWNAVVAGIVVNVVIKIELSILIIITLLV